MVLSGIGDSAELYEVESDEEGAGAEERVGLMVEPSNVADRLVEALDSSSSRSVFEVVSCADPLVPFDSPVAAELDVPSFIFVEFPFAPVPVSFPSSPTKVTPPS